MRIGNAVPDTLTSADLMLLEKCPKATLYAIAKDLAQRIAGVEDEQAIRRELVSTWRLLHANGIVSQKAPRRYLRAGLIASAGRDS